MFLLWSENPFNMIDGRPAAKNTVNIDESGATETIWTSKRTGLVLKPETVSGRLRIFSRYEHSNVQAPAHAQ